MLKTNGHKKSPLLGPFELSKVAFYLSLPFPLCLRDHGPQGGSLQTFHPVLSSTGRTRLGEHPVCLTRFRCDKSVVDDLKHLVQCVA